MPHSGLLYHFLCGYAPMAIARCQIAPLLRS